MKKGATIAILIILGLVVAGGLVIAAIVELVEAAIAFIFWAIVILVGYFFIKSKT